MMPSSTVFTVGADMLVFASPAGVRLWGLGPKKETRSWMHEVVHEPPSLCSAASVSLWTLPVKLVTVAGDMPVVAVVARRLSDVSLSASEDETHTVHLFDGITGFHLAELSFRGAPVRALLANRRVLLVAMEDGFHLVDLLSLTHLRLEPVNQPLNLSLILALSATPRTDRPPATPSLDEGVPSSTFVAAYPRNSARAAGFPHGVRLLSITLAEPAEAQRDPATEDCVHFARRDVALHAHPLGAVSLSMDGTLLASASTDGTTVKVTNTDTGAICHVFQRGAVRGAVHTIAFNHASTVVAALSHSGTVHIFCLSAPVGNHVMRLTGVGSRPRAFKTKRIPRFLPTSVADDKAPAGPVSAGIAPHPLSHHYTMAFAVDDLHFWVASTYSAESDATLMLFSLASHDTHPVEVRTISAQVNVL